MKRFQFSAISIRAVLVIILFSGFAMANDKVQLCHYPPGNTENWRIISVSENALAKHLAHGDRTPMILYEDFDGDGYGDPDDSIETCEMPVGFVENDTDCDDINPDINPSMDEISGDGVDNDCDPTTSDEIFTFTGILTKVPREDMKGWTVCYQDTYDNILKVDEIQGKCTKANIMLACGEVGSADYTVVAHAPREDVFFYTGSDNGSNTPHVANGVGWYFADDWSMGFAPEGETIYRYSCDIETEKVEERLCWHTVGYDGGFSCGVQRWINDSKSWERFVLEAD
jgi:hypothetical protein